MPRVAQAQPPSVPMQPASLALIPAGGQLVGSDGALELDVPAGAVTAADLTASGGGMSLLARQVLPASGDPAADLVVVVSNVLYGWVVGPGHPGLDAAEFKPVDIQVKSFQAPAWLWTPSADSRGQSVP